MKALPTLISSQTLKNLLRTSTTTKIAVLEADLNKQFQKEFQQAHIPQAKYFEQLECTEPTKFIPRGLPETKCFENYLSKLGVSNSDHIVLYDRSPMGFYASSRAWWLFKTLGMENLSILNGGFYNWMKEIQQIEPSKPEEESNEKKGQFKVKFNPSMIKTYDEILKLVSNPKAKYQIADARGANAFFGANAGHIPGSVNIPYTDVFDQSTQQLKSLDELQKLFTKSGVDLSKETIYTCQTGTTASTLAFIGHLLGQKSFPVYNGSFTEWQQRAPAHQIAHSPSAA